MGSKNLSGSTFGRRLRERREALGLAQEKVGVAIGLDESSARARISRYELEPSENSAPDSQGFKSPVALPVLR